MSGPDDARLREEGDRIEQILEELRASAGPTTWPRIEELVQRIVGLYGAGLERMLAHATAGDDVVARLTGDELVSNLLILHDLHPLSPVERIERALDEVRPYLGSHAGGVELLGIRDGVAKLRLVGSCDGCPSSRVTVDQAIERAILQAAPEVVAVEVEGVAPPRPVPASLPRTGWVRLDGLAPVPAGTFVAVTVAGAEIVLASPANNVLVAYRNACACGSRLDGASMDGPRLVCTSCGGAFDLVRAGRGDEGRALDPVPLLSDAAGVRIAVPEAA